MNIMLMMHYSYTQLLCLHGSDFLNIYGYDQGVITKQIKAITGSDAEADIIFSSSDLLINFISDDDSWTDYGFRIMALFLTKGNNYTYNVILSDIDVDFKS